MSISDGDLGPLLGVKSGSRIEVLFEVDSKNVFFKASVVGKTNKKAALDEDVSIPVYQIRYDAAHGFDVSTAEVGFLDVHSMYDASERTVMEWRKEGSTWIEGPDPENELLDEEDVPIVRPLSPVSARREAEAFVGKMVKESLMNAENGAVGTNKLPFHVRSHLAERIRTMSESLVENVAVKLETTGRLTAEDARDIVRRLSS